MKRKLLSLALALCMLMTLMPVAALAEGEEQTPYEALKAAIDTAPTDGTTVTIVLQDDISGMTTDQILTIATGKNIVLDMNGKSITVEASFTGRPIVNEGTLTVTGSGTIDSSASQRGYGAIRNDGTLTIENGSYIGNVYGDGSAIRNGIGSKLTVNGGYFAATSAIYNVGEATIYKGEFATLSCSGCSTPWAYALNNRDEGSASGKMEILPEKDEDVKVHGTQGALASVGGAEVYVKGGTFYTYPCKNNHTNNTFYAVYVSGKAGAPASCVIDGGEFSTTGSQACIYVNNTNPSDNGGEPGQGILKINGGSFEQGENATLVRFSEQNDSMLVISGGTFSSDITTYFPEGAALTQNSSGTVVADENATAVATVNSVPYTSLAAAITAAQDNDTITLLKDVVVAVPSGTGDGQGAINIDKDITIDGQGYSISADEESFDLTTLWSTTVAGKYHVINITGGNVQLKDLTIDGGWDESVDTDTSSGNAARSGVNVYQNGTVTLDNVTVQNCSVYGVAIQGSNVNVTATDLTTDGNRWGVNVDGGSEFEIDSGTINGDFVVEGNGSAEIKGGTFNDAVKTQGSDNNTSLSISGGTFAQLVNEEYCAESYKPVQTSDGKYTVISDNSYLITIVGPNGPMEAAAVVLDINGNVTGVQQAQEINGTLYAPTNTTLPYWRYVGWTFTAAKDGTTETFGTATTLTQALADWLTAKVKGGYTLTMDSATPGIYTPTTSGSSSTPTYTVSVDSTKNGTVTVSPKNAKKGAEVTITVKPDAGYEVDEVTVTDKNGKTIKVTEGRNGKYTFTMPASKVDVEVTFVKEYVAPAISFDDVSKGAWYYDAAQYVADKDIMSGTGGNNFSPDMTTSRAMIWTILARLDGQNVSVTYGNWYDKAQMWAMTNSVSDGTNPNGSITREQLAVMLYSYAMANGYTGKSGVSLSRYLDASETSAWAVEAMEWAVGNGLISSTGGNLLSPTTTATRAQVAVILMNFCENIAK